MQLARTIAYINTILFYYNFINNKQYLENLLLVNKLLQITRITNFALLRSLVLLLRLKFLPERLLVYLLKCIFLQNKNICLLM